MLKLFGLRKCTTCQKAVAWLDQKKLSYSFTDVKEEGLTKTQVSQWAKAVGGWEARLGVWTDVDGLRARGRRCSGLVARAACRAGHRGARARRAAWLRGSCFERRRPWA